MLPTSYIKLALSTAPNQKQRSLCLSHPKIYSHPCLQALYKQTPPFHLENVRIEAMAYKSILYAALNIEAATKEILCCDSQRSPAF